MKPAKKLAKAVRPIPEGYHTATTRLTVRGADRAIEFYKKAFGAELIERMDGPDGRSVVHSCLRIGDSRIFLSDEMPEMGTRSPEALGGATSSIYLYVRDADEAFRRAVDAGGKVVRPVMDAFWGDRCGTIADPFGYQWDLATHVEDVPPEEMKKRAEEFFRGGWPHSS